MFGGGNASISGVPSGIDMVESGRLVSGFFICELESGIKF